MPIRHFGILSPVLGDQLSIPKIALAEGYTADSENVQVRWGELHRCKMRNEVLAVTPDTNEVLRYHWFINNNGNGYLFAFTEDNIYKWDGSAWINWADHGIGGLQTTTRWSVVSFNNKVIATNGIDFVLVGDENNEFDALESAKGMIYTDLTTTTSTPHTGTTGTTQAVGEYIQAAKFVAVFENYLFAGYTKEQGTWYPHRMRWCDIGDHEEWSAGDAGYMDVPGSDHLSGTGRYRDFLIIFKESSYHKLWLSIDDYVFGRATWSEEVGTRAPDSIVNGQNGELYFFASDYTYREVHYGERSQPVDKVLKNIPRAAVGRIQATRIDWYGEVWLAIPEGIDASGDPVAANTQVLTFKDDRENPVWGKRAIAVTAFGIFHANAPATYTWCTIAAAFPTWDDWASESWDSVESSTGFTTDIGGEDNGKSYALHNSGQDKGAAFTGYFVLATDLMHGDDGGMMIRNKRIHAVTIYARAGGTDDELDLYIKRDTEANWQSVGTISLYGGGEFVRVRKNCDLTGGSFQLKCEADNDFQIVGVVFEFSFMGVAE